MLGDSVGLVTLLVHHLGLVVFTVLGLVLVGYLAYSMLRPERF